jgi:uncharacterized protein (DUF2062 family)
MELLLELLLEVILGPILELILEGAAHLLGRFGKGILQFAVILAVGAIAGVVFSAFFPNPIVAPVVPGASLFLSPLLAGTTMHFFGHHRERRGHQPTSLASFWGGALLGFGVAAARLLSLGG